VTITQIATTKKLAYILGFSIFLASHL